MPKDKGLVFNIQKYSIHDGPGIRTLVFFKGCPLSCKWCSNPEGISPVPEISYKSNRCIKLEKCGLCSQICPEQAIVADENGTASIKRNNCSNCLKCVKECPSHAIETMGRWMTVEEILNEVTADEGFYKRSKGGMTLSGGEPLLQADFVINLLRQAKQDGLETAIETTGCVPWEKAKPVFDLLDYIHMDIKTVDEKKHFQYTGHNNKLILDNFRKLCSEFPNKPIITRTPVIPHFNDTVEELQAIVDFVNEAGKNTTQLSYELLPFHNYGSSKYEYLDKPYEFTEQKNMDKNVARSLRSKLRSTIPILEVR